VALVEHEHEDVVRLVKLLLACGPPGLDHHGPPPAGCRSDFGSCCVHDREIGGVRSGGEQQRSRIRRGGKSWRGNTRCPIESMSLETIIVFRL
jgi:hypothetical protein